MFVDPFLELGLDFGQINKDMLRLSDFGRGGARRALRIDQFCSVDKLTAAVTLVTLSVTIVAHRALTADKTISEKALTLLAVLLINNLFESFALLENIFEDSLRNFSLLGGTGTTEAIEIAIKPIINLFVDCVVVVTNLLTRFTFFHSFGLRSGTVLICTTDVDRVVAGKARIPGENVSREHTSNDVTEVGHIVDIWECRSDKDVTATFLGQDCFGREADDLGIRLTSGNTVCSFLDGSRIIAEVVKTNEIVLSLKCF